MPHKNIFNADYAETLACYRSMRKAGQSVTPLGIQSAFGISKKEAERTICLGLIEGIFAFTDKEGIYKMNSSDDASDAKASHDLGVVMMCRSIQRKADLH